MSWGVRHSCFWCSSCQLVEVRNAQYSQFYFYLILFLACWVSLVHTKRLVLNIVPHSVTMVWRATIKASSSIWTSYADTRLFWMTFMEVIYEVYYGISVVKNITVRKTSSANSGVYLTPGRVALKIQVEKTESIKKNNWVWEYFLQLHIQYTTIYRNRRNGNIFTSSRERKDRYFQVNLCP